MAEIFLAPDRIDHRRCLVLKRILPHLAEESTS